LRYETKWLKVFFGVFLLAFYGADDININGDFPDVPTLDGENLTIINSLLFVFEIVIFFFFLQGLGLFGLPVIYATFISLALNIGLLYVLARLVRGGG